MRSFAATPKTANKGMGAKGLEPASAKATAGQAPGLLGVIRIGNRSNFNANADPVDLQRVKLTRCLGKHDKLKKLNKFGASPVQVKTMETTGGIRRS